MQVLSQGHQEGLLTDVQRRLIEGLMHLAGEPVTLTLTPASQILGISDNVGWDEALNFARRYGVNTVAIRQAAEPDAWYGYVRVVDVAVRRQPLASLVRNMPVIDAGASKLEALLTLRTSGTAYGMVKSGDRLLGLISHYGLSEQLFRAPQTIGGRTAVRE